jgi:hypothetical protein
MGEVPVGGKLGDGITGVGRTGRLGEGTASVGRGTGDGTATDCGATAGLLATTAGARFDVEIAAAEVGTTSAASAP